MRFNLRSGGWGCVSEGLDWERMTLELKNWSVSCIFGQVIEIVVECTCSTMYDN